MCVGIVKCSGGSTSVTVQGCKQHVNSEKNYHESGLKY